MNHAPEKKALIHLRIKLSKAFMDPFMDPSKSVLSNNRLNNNIEWSFEHAKYLRIAKSFGPHQPARIAQADVDRYFSQMH